ncbi:MAG: ribonuclease HI [Thiomicrorhabdus sp.]|nr:MAG: ribonuclease HI [Thiomicrorhabdus sp.]
MQVVEIYTDGGCRGNPGPGGWGVLMKYGQFRKELKGHKKETTNNQMELMAAIQAFELLNRPCKARITTDSKYVLEGITKWVIGWKKKGWKTASNQPVKNKELWQRLDQAIQSHEVEWCWVKGHSGHVGNERVDELANLAIDELLAR